MSCQDLWAHLRSALRLYSRTHGERLAAAFAYYATFSLAPLLVLALAVAGLVYGRQSDAARAELLTQARPVLGVDGVRMMDGILSSAAAAPGAGLWASVTSALVLGIGATALYARLQDALNTIWEASPPRTALVQLVWMRVRALLLVMGTGLVMVAGLLLNALLTGLASWIAAPVLLAVGERGLSLFLLAALFSLLYRTLPDAPVRWHEAVGGGLGAAGLVTLGTAALGAYLGAAAVPSAYGAAGTLAAFLLWVYYSAQIFFLGAAWTAAARPPAPPQTPRPPAAPAPPPPPWPRRLLWMSIGAVVAWLLHRRS